MFETLTARAAAFAEQAAERRRRRIVAAAREEAPSGVAVAEAGEAIVLAGRRLSVRRLRDAGFRAFVESLR
jgi:hypothetical protein